MCLLLKYSVWLYVVFHFIHVTLCEHNLTEWTLHRREKRTLIFQNAGTAKIVAGVIMPFDLQDKKPWRQMNLAMNFQAQYALPQAPIYWWNKFDGRTLEDAKRRYDGNDAVPEDESQKIVYKMIEMYMNNAGKNGRKCLQRAICENADIDEAEGLYSEIVKLILTPNEGCRDLDLKNAYVAGKAGVSCLQLYPECPLGAGLLDAWSIVDTNGIL